MILRTIQRPISIKTDIAHANIPLLLSRASLQVMAVMLDFNLNILRFEGNSYIPLSIRPGGHLTFEFGPSKPNDGGSNKILIILSHLRIIQMVCMGRFKSCW